MMDVSAATSVSRMPELAEEKLSIAMSRLLAALDSLFWYEPTLERNKLIFLMAVSTSAKKLRDVALSVRLTAEMEVKPAVVPAPTTFSEAESLLCNAGPKSNMSVALEVGPTWMNASVGGEPLIWLSPLKLVDWEMLSMSDSNP